MNPISLFLDIVSVGGALFVVGLLGLAFDALRCLYLALTRSAPKTLE